MIYFQDPLDHGRDPKICDIEFNLTKENCNLPLKKLPHVVPVIVI